jgi:hypothetical protein
MSLHRAFALAATLLLAAMPSSAAVTISQNEALLKGDDPRLDRKVTYSASALRIADVLTELSKSTGVVMAAGSDNNDWMVYDRKVTVFVTDMRLGDLMRELAGILRFHWSRGGDEGKWTYRLWQDKQQWQEEESLRDSAEDAMQRKAREKRENAVADLVNLGSLTSADADKLKAADPWRYVLATEPLGRDVAEFIHSFPDARSAFVQGSEVSFPVSSLPPLLQDAVRRIATSYDSLAKSIGASEDHSELLSRFDRLQVTINRKTLGAGTDVYSRSLLGRITIGAGLESLEIPLFDPTSPMARALGSAIVSLKSGVPKDEVGKRLESALKDAADSVQSPTRQAERDITSDPALRTSVKLFDQATTATLPVVLKELAEKTKLNVISDHFLAPPVSFPGGEKSLGAQLELVRTVYGSNWEKARGVLRFRDTEWFRKRAWEVPQVWLDYWLARGKRNDGLMLQDLMEIGCLRDEQIDHTIMLHPELVGMGAGDAARNRQILRFYGSLTPEQRTQLAAGPIEAAALRESQWAALQRALATKGAAYAAAEKGSQLVGLSESTSGQDEVRYTFSYYPGPNEPPVTFTLAKGGGAIGMGDAAFQGKKAIRIDADAPGQDQPSQ